MSRIISFDLDGTITTKEFADLVWLEGIPTIYARDRNIDIDTAKRYILEEYDKIGDGKVEWYDLGYWIRKWNLKTTPGELLSRYSHAIHLYPDAVSVIPSLSKKYTLIITSNARREFIDIQLEKTGFKKFFTYIFSSTSDENIVKKNPRFYKIICDKLDVHPDDIIHIGDDREADFLIPRSTGITSFYLDRNRSKSINDEDYNNNVFSSLIEFEKYLQGL